MEHSRESLKNAPPHNPRPAILFGMAVIILGMGTFAAWASVAQLSSAIVGSGTVKVISNRKIVQSSETGTVRAIAVQNGERVQTGDVLVRLDDTAARASLDAVQANYDLAQASVARLLAERDNADTIQFPKSLLLFTGDPTVAETIHAQQRLFEAGRNALNGQTAVIKKQIKQLTEQITGLKAQLAAVNQQLSLNTRQQTDLQKLLKAQLVSRSRLDTLEADIVDLQGQKGDLRAQIAAAEAQIAQAELQILQLRLTFEKEASDTLGTKQANMFTLAQNLTEARHKLEQTVIRAPADGVVVALDVHTIGGVIEQGQTLMEIVPAADRLVIEMQVRPTDIDNVAKGLEAEIVFPGFPRREMPRLVGKVSYVSADSLTNSRTGASYYLVRVSLDANQMRKLGDHQLLPGMPAEVFVKTGAHTPLAYLTEPLLESFSHAWREP